MVISRVPAPDDGSAPKTSSAVAILLVLAVVLGIWLLNGRDPGTGTAGSGATDIADASETEYVGSYDPPSDQPTGPSATASSSSSPSSPAQAGTDPDSGLPLVDLADLPDEAGDTVELIDEGPPYPYDKDGSTFGNVEGLLPDAERGYYAEFTVVTPGSGDRGARRIVVGDEGELYWTADHYASFERILR